jgi:glycosyltransferase involved in cell wall biosynthesis
MSEAPDLSALSFPMASRRPEKSCAPLLAERTALGKFERSVSLLAWAYNEELLIESFLSQAVELLQRTVDDWEIILINDGSTDRTGAIADEYAQREPRVRVLHNERNLNVGQSARRAIAGATKEYMLWQTIDWSYDISALRIYLELTKYFDVVVGVRPYPIRMLSYIPVIRSIFRIRTRSDSIFRAIISLTNYYVLRILYGPKFHDFQNVQIYPLRLVHAFTLTGSSSFLAPELLFRSYQAGMTFMEVPIPFIPRKVGHAKGARPRALIRAIVDILKNWFRWGYELRTTILWDSLVGRQRRRVFRLTEVQFLDEEVIGLAAPLFRCFRPSTK